jgi:heme exporter protein CcmD
MSDHAEFIIAAFLIAGAVVAVILGAIMLDHRSLRRALAKFPPRGEGDGA